MADEAVPFHELLVGGRSVSGVRPDAARRVGLVEKSIAQTAALIGGGVRRAPFANEAETAIERCGSDSRTPESPDRQAASIHPRAACSRGLALVYLGVFDCPARVAILLAELRGLVFPVVGDAAALDRLLRVLGVAPTRSGDQARIDDLGRHGDGTELPKHCRSVASKRANNGPMAPGLVSFSRNSQIVRASGTRSDNPNPRKRMNDSRSLIRNSARSSASGPLQLI